MDGEIPAISTDFLQDLDLWLLQGGAASTTINRQSLDVAVANGGESSLEAALLTPTAPVTGTDKTDAGSSFVATLTDDPLLWTDLTANSSVDGGSVALKRLHPKLLTPQLAGKGLEMHTAQVRKGRPPAVRKASPLEPPMKKGKTNKSTSQRQKEELAYLREKAAQLEMELTSMKKRNQEELERQQQKEKETEIDGVEVSTTMITRKLDEFGGPMQPEKLLWERIAKRQREQKAKSEVENVKLREMVQGQMWLTKSLERLIRKRKIWDQLQENSSTQDRREGKKEEKALEEMLRDVDAWYPHVDKVLRDHGISESDPAVDVKDDANMKYSPPDGVYLEYKEKKFMPFDYLLLDKVMWRSIGEGKLKHEDTQLTIIKNTENLVFFKATLPLSQKGENKDVGVSINLSIMKRFNEGNRVVFVWLANTNAKRLQDETLSPVLLVQKGCATMEPATLPDGSYGSVIRSYTRSVPTLSSQLSQENSKVEHREVGLLTEMVFAVYQQSRQSINQTLENLFLDEMMTKNATSTPATLTTDINVSF